MTKQGKTRFDFYDVVKDCVNIIASFIVTGGFNDLLTQAKDFFRAQDNSIPLTFYLPESELVIVNEKTYNDWFNERSHPDMNVFIYCILNQDVWFDKEKNIKDKLDERFISKNSSLSIKHPRDPDDDLAGTVKKKNINLEVFEHLKPIIIRRSDECPSRGIPMTKKHIYDILFGDLPKPIPTHDYYDMPHIDELGVKAEIDKIVCCSTGLVSHHLMAGLWNAFNFDTRNLGGDESTLSRAYQTFFEATINGYSDGISKKEAFKVDFDNNRAATTLTALRNPRSTSEKNTQTRRDFLCYVNDVVLIYGEEKAQEDDMNICLTQLHQNTGQMMTEVYGNIPFVLAYAIAGQFVNFFAFTRQTIDENGQIKRHEIPIPIKLNQKAFNMTDVYHRLIIFKIMLNAIRFYHGCVLNFLFPQRKPPCTFRKKRRSDFLRTYINLRREKETGGAVFVKTFDQFNLYSATNTTSLLDIYQLLKDNKIRHSYKNFDFAKFTENPQTNGQTNEQTNGLKRTKSKARKTKQIITKVVTESKYCSHSGLGFISSERDVKKFILHIGEALYDLHSHGFVHRDLRPDNIIYDDTSEVNDVDDESILTPGEFLLIDFDHSDKIGEKLKVLHNGHPDHLQVGSLYTIKDDLFAFGSLILTLKGILMPSEIEKLAIQIKNDTIDIFNFLENLKKIKTCNAEKLGYF